MELRCKQGDLAVILNAIHPENVGRFVTVEREMGYFNAGEVYHSRWGMCIAVISGFYWLIKTPENAPATIDNGATSIFGFIADVYLQPIRDPGVDETNEVEKVLEEQL